MEYLSLEIGSLKEDKKFGFHLKYKRTNTVSILSADDLLIFYKGEAQSVGLVKEFSLASGLYPNMDKLAVYLTGVTNGLEKEIQEVLGMPLVELPLRCLGVPLSHKKLTIS